jgi:hypothetical protein
LRNNVNSFHFKLVAFPVMGRHSCFLNPEWPMVVQSMAFMKHADIKSVKLVFVPAKRLPMGLRGIPRRNSSEWNTLIGSTMSSTTRTLPARIGERSSISDSVRFSAESFTGDPCGA